MKAQLTISHFHSSPSNNLRSLEAFHPPFHSHCRWLQETTIDSGITAGLMQTSDPRINEQVGGKTERVTMLKQNCPQERYNKTDRRYRMDFVLTEGSNLQKQPHKPPAIYVIFLASRSVFFFSFF